MPQSNSHTTYGSVTKTFHWLTALLIFSAIPLGIIANNMAYALKDTTVAPDPNQLALTATLFSLHKTIGVTVFFVALARILWAISQPKPGLLNGDKGPEAWAAETVHWLLYGSLLAVPLTGWIHHAATSGFAPIWWPFGQTLPFVAQSEALAQTTATLHYVLVLVLGASILLHIGGALKHHVIDRDATLRRMLPGHTPGQPTEKQPGHVLPFLTALMVWGATLGAAATLGWFDVKPHATGETAALDAVDSDWQVSDGTLSITVRQLGSDVTGQFADWTAQIAYDETPDATGKHGTVEVVISTGTLTLGSVTAQATGAGYLDVQKHPTATFTADLISDGSAHTARGTLTILDQTIPVEMPFDLTIEGDTATASGGFSVDRRDFGIGGDVKDEKTLAFAVAIAFELAATRP